MNNDMAKGGYIFIATNGDDYTEDKEWKQQYGCVKVISQLRQYGILHREGVRKDGRWVITNKNDNNEL